METFEKLLDDFATGRTPEPGPQIKRQNSAPFGGATTLTGDVSAGSSKAGSGKPAAKPQKPTQAARPPKDDGSARKPRPPEEVSGKKPKMLKQARKSGADDLKQIKGVGPKLEGTLNELGVYHFDQIAAWTPAEVSWVDDYLNFKGRIDRDDWISQAKTLAEGDETEFSRRSAKTRA